MKINNGIVQFGEYLINLIKNRITISVREIMRLCCFGILLFQILQLNAQPHISPRMDLQSDLIAFAGHKTLFSLKTGGLAKLPDDYSSDLKLSPEVNLTTIRYDTLTAGLNLNFFRRPLKTPSGKNEKIEPFSVLKNGGKRKVSGYLKSDSTLNKLEDLASVTDTLRIKRIILNGINLTEIPQTIYRFKNVEEIFLNKNQLTSVRLDFSRLTKLRQLHLQENLLTNNQVHLSENKCLQVLNLNRNKLTDIPEEVKNCKRLRHLHLAANQLSELSDQSFKRIRKIENLNFYRTNLTGIPAGIRKIRKVQILDLYHNQLREIPSQVTRLRHLTHLAVSYNTLTALPVRIGKLKKLHTVYAHHNQLSELPQSITRLKDLKILDIGFNAFSDFPQEIMSFRNLIELDLSSNNFSEFPEELLRLPPVKKLYLGGNPFLLKQSKRDTLQWDALKEKRIQVFY